MASVSYRTQSPRKYQDEPIFIFGGMADNRPEILTLYYGNSREINQLVEPRSCPTRKPAWKIIPYQSGMNTSQLYGCAVTEYPTQSGPADYALYKYRHRSVATHIQEKTLLSYWGQTAFSKAASRYPAHATR